VFGLTDKGFKRKRYTDIIESMETRAKNLFGENVNLTERSPLGLFIRVIAWSLGIVWQLAEKVYNSAYVDTAEGTQLDHVAKYIGIQRRPAERAVGEVTITGDDGTTIPAGFLVATGDDIEFETTQLAIIGAGGNVTVGIIAREPGAGSNVPAGTITKIINPTAGVDSVTNPEPTAGGRNEETDAELRDRYVLSVAKGGASTIDSIRASLLDTPGVRAALVVANNTMEVDADGRPPKSVECYVLGGKAADVGKTILGTKAAGIQAHGSEPVVVKDDAGLDHTIYFSFAQVQAIWVNVALVTNPEYPADGDAQVKTQIIRYLGGTDADSQEYAGITMGEDAIYTRLIKVVYRVPGIEDVDLEVSTDGSVFVKENILISPSEVAETDHVKVVVTSA